MAGVSRPPLERFMELFVVLPGPLKSKCWVWQGKLSTNGYGKFNAGYDPTKRTYPIFWAHRWSHEHYLGPIPPGYDVDHKCGNHACVNPKHLRAREAREHRAEAAKKMWKERRK